MSIPAAVFFSILLYFTSTRLGWLNPTTGFCLLLGVVEGLLVGLYVGSTVTGELAKKTETTAWRTLLISLFSFSPLLVIFILYGTSMFLPYSAYFVLPYAPAYAAVSGWLFSRFEKKRSVQIFNLSFFSARYWTEPTSVSKRVPREGIEDLSLGFDEFIDSVISKDFSGIFYEAAYAETFLADLKAMPRIERPARDFLSKILETMKKYQQRLRAATYIFTILNVVILTSFFVLAATDGFGLMKIVGEGGIVDNQAILVLFVIPVAFNFGGIVAARLLLKRRYKKKISTLLSPISPGISSNLKSLIEP
jgi:hypothetical protein